MTFWKEGTKKKGYCGRSEWEKMERKRMKCLRDEGQTQEEKDEEEMVDRNAFPSLSSVRLLRGSLERQYLSNTHCTELIQTLIFSLKDTLRVGMG